MPRLHPGDVLENRYRVERSIGRGGMSTVYRCIDLRLGRSVAAKVLSDEHALDPAARSHFKREARAMAQMNNRCLVNVYDTGVDVRPEGDIVFLIMELITGGTLRELLAERGPMPPHAATAVMMPMLTGLAVAHDRGIVHLDIKPDNILIDADHQVKLGDFGLVRAAGGAETTGTITGTVAYLSPEQVTGHGIGPASDVYSAGIVLYELLTGTTPFTGPTPLARAQARLTTIAPPPSSQISGVPPLFDHLVATATALDPAERFRDAHEFLDALSDVAASLHLPEFQVPVPRNAAAQRAAADAENATDVLTRITPAERVGHTSQLEPATTVLGDERPVAPRPTDTAVFNGPLVPAPATPGAPAPAPTRTPPQRPVNNRRAGSIIAWLIVVILLVAGVGVGGWWFGSGRYGELPTITGLSQQQAVLEVENAGYTTQLWETYDDTVAAGAAINTDPPSGSRIPRGQSVTVLISLGAPTVPVVPTNGDPAAFTAAATERTLTATHAPPEHSDDVAAGRILRVSPEPGTTVTVGSQVSMVLSAGPAPTTVPDVHGKSRSEAEAALQEAGLRVGTVTKEFDAAVPGDAVISTDPPSGSAANRTDTVDLTVSTALTVPDVTGMSQSEAEDALRAAGLSATVTTSATAIGTRNREVVAQKPAAGSTLDPDGDTTTITLTIAGRQEVPDVRGMRVEDARAFLTDRGYRVDVASGQTGQVTRQSPAAGTAASTGASVRLFTR